MKKELGRRTWALRELAGSLDMMRPAEVLTSVETPNERKNRELCSASRFPRKPAGFGDESVELVIPPCGDAYQLWSLAGQLEDRLHEDDSYGSVMRTAYSVGSGTAITVLMQPPKFSSLVIKLANMPEVERVEEESDARGALCSFPDRLGVLPGSPTKSVRVILVEADTARRELAMVSN